MYRQYMSQEKYDDIVNSDRVEPDIFPHCNQTMFHEPGVCAFCDGYFRRHPRFVPESYVTPEANGWGGNKAPIIDDEKAAQEQAEWNEWMQDSVKYEINERKRLAERIEKMLKVFRRPRP